MKPTRCIAVTGADTFLGRRLIDRWRRPGAQVRVVHLEGDAAELTDTLQKEDVASVVHLGLKDIPSVEASRQRVDEVTATRRLLEACSQAGVGRLVVPSTTMCYGPRLENPQHLTEDAELHGHPGAPWVKDRVHVERLVDQFRDDHPRCEVTVLRHCWIMGPRVLDAVVRFFDSDWVPTLLGYDPLMQFVHEDDVVALLDASALESHPGVFNVVGEGVLPLSGYLRLAGKWNVPTPSRLLGFAAGAPVPLSNSSTSNAFIDYLKYIWVASGESAVREFGPRTYSSQEAWLAMIGAHRLQNDRARN